MNELSKCPNGYYRSKKTGQCRKDNLKPCKDGFVRDEGTRRCKRIKSSKKKKEKSTLKAKECRPGFSRTGKNNRCQKNCPPGTTRSGKNNKCLKDCPPGRMRNKTGRCVDDDEMDSFIVEEDEPLVGDGKRMLEEEVAELKKGKLGKDLRPNITCIEMFDDDALQKELDKRKRIREGPQGPGFYNGQPVKMLVGRKKVPKNE